MIKTNPKLKVSDGEGEVIGGVTEVVARSEMDERRRWSTGLLKHIPKERWERGH